MLSMAILRLLEANSSQPGTSPLYNRKETRDLYILRPSREAPTTMTADLPRLRATTNSTQNIITEGSLRVTTTAILTITPAPLLVMDRNMANLAWTALGKLPDSALPLPADTVENERFVTQRGSVLCVFAINLPIFFGWLTLILSSSF
jgi:hypothetical protein